MGYSDENCLEIQMKTSTMASIPLPSVSHFVYQSRGALLTGKTEWYVFLKLPLFSQLFEKLETSKAFMADHAFDHCICLNIFEVV